MFLRSIGFTSRGRPIETGTDAGRFNAVGLLRPIPETVRRDASRCLSCCHQDYLTYVEKLLDFNGGFLIEL